jgi:protein TonB
MTSFAIPPTLPAALQPVRFANRHALPIAVTLLVHGLVLSSLLPALHAVTPEAPQIVMIGVAVSVPTPPAPVQVASAPPPPVVSKVPVTVPVRQTITTARSTPTNAAVETPVELAQNPAQNQAQNLAPDATPSSASPAPAAPATRGIETSADNEPPRYQAAYLNNPQPPYPPMSRKLHEQGSVRLHVMVNAAGEAETVRVKSGSGYERLDQAAIAAVQKWRFIPARQHGQAVAGWVEVPIQFHLEN